MEICIISDTHKKRPDEKLKKLFETEFKKADLILHAGDLTDTTFLDFLEEYNVLAVLGNSDSSDLKNKLPLKKVLQIGKITIGIAKVLGYLLPS